MIKAAIFTSLVFASAFSYAQQKDIILDVKLSTLKKVTESAIKEDYAKADGFNMVITDKDITDVKIDIIGADRIEMSALAPATAASDGMGYFCEVTVKKDSSDKYKAVSTHCSKYD